LTKPVAVTKIRDGGCTVFLLPYVLQSLCSNGVGFVKCSPAPDFKKQNLLSNTKTKHPVFCVRAAKETKNQKIAGCDYFIELDPLCACFILRNPTNQSRCLCCSWAAL
ncbi:MAG: hypothetical protein ACPL7K_03770, partial [Armatimonadota bacterium]